MRFDRIFGIFCVVAFGCSSSSSGSSPDAAPETGVDPAMPADAGDASAVDTSDDTAADAPVDTAPADVPVDTGPPPECYDDGLYFYMLNTVDIGKFAGEKLWGVNVDGEVSDETDAETCFHSDRESPPPDSLVGVDNELGPAVAGLSIVFDVTEALSMAILSGQLLPLVQLDGVDDLVHDSSVSVSLFYGSPQDVASFPVLGDDGRLAPCETWDIISSWLESDDVTAKIRFNDAQIVDGRVVASSEDSFPVAVPVMGGTVELEVLNPQARFTITDDALTLGVIGGALDRLATRQAMIGLAPGLESFVDGLLGNAADLNPDSAGECQGISVGFTFEGVASVRGGVVDPETP